MMCTPQMAEINLKAEALCIVTHIADQPVAAMEIL